MKQWSLAATFVLPAFAAALACAAEAPAKSSDKAPLGSPEFYPSPERPYGWRGDWTGRFPGATPPTQWSRRAKGVTLGMKQQAKKPAGEPGADAKPVDYLTIRDWLVAGPFSVDDPVKDIDKDFLGGETAVMPDEGAKAAEGIVWKFVHTNMDNAFKTDGHLFLDFVYQYGKRIEYKDTEYPGGGKVDRNHKGMINVQVEGDFHNKLAYAHTYLYAPTAGSANLHVYHAGDACRAWLNGASVKLEARLDRGVAVKLEKGWNRLLLKISCAEGKIQGWDHWQSKWACAVYVTPPPPVQYETSNVAWMTPLTGRSASQPIVVGDSLFVGAGISDLLCIEKASGKVRWLRTITPWDALNNDDKAACKDTIEPLVTQLTQANNALVAALNERVSTTGMSSDQATALGVLLKTKTALERNIHVAFRKIDAKRFLSIYNNEWSSSNATPVSDGQRVYWVCGGAGGAGETGGASVICAFDLAGNLVWGYHDSFGRQEHGIHASPALAKGKLVYGASRTLLSLDASTGKVAWRHDLPNRDGGKGWDTATTISGEAPVIVSIAGEPMIVSKFDSLGICMDVRRLSDGTVIASTQDLHSNMGVQTPVVEDGFVYYSDLNRPGHDSQGLYNHSFVAFKLPDSSAPSNVPLKPIFETQKPTTYNNASPLIVNGVFMSIGMNGHLTAFDIKDGKELYRLFPDWHNCSSRHLWGVCASPTLAATTIYQVNGTGETLLLKPGPKYGAVGRNVLENIFTQDGNPCGQEGFYTAPVFEGKAMYLRGQQYLYCIGEPAK